ncbi:MAG: hypothetical protein H6714_09100 [Myxococcales bacterium]|nr:hypothetical protein [Myxococcales bacterium]
MWRLLHPTAAFTCALVLSTTGCFAITDLDRFKDECEGDLNTRRDFNAEITNLQAFMGALPPANARVELRVVNEEFVNVARAVVDGLNERTESESVKVFMPRAIPHGKHQVHIYIDLNQNHRYDRVIGALAQQEPSWIAEMCPSGLFRFNATEALQDIEDPATSSPGGLFSLKLTDLFPHLGGEQKLELLVFSDENVVPAIGYYRAPGVLKPELQVNVPGIITSETHYRVDFYIDKNADGVYSGHPTDHSWRLALASEGDTLSQTWQHTGEFDDVEF